MRPEDEQGHHETSAAQVPLARRSLAPTLGDFAAQPPASLLTLLDDAGLAPLPPRTPGAPFGMTLEAARAAFEQAFFPPPAEGDEPAHGT